MRETSFASYSIGLFVSAHLRRCAMRSGNSSMSLSGIFKISCCERARVLPESSVVFARGAVVGRRRPHALSGVPAEQHHAAVAVAAVPTARGAQTLLRVAQ